MFLTWTTIVLILVFFSSIPTFGPTPIPSVLTFLTLPSLVYCTRPAAAGRKIGLAYVAVSLASVVAYYPITIWPVIKAASRRKDGSKNHVLWDQVAQVGLLQVVFSGVSVGFIFMALLMYRVLCKYLQDREQQHRASGSTGGEGFSSRISANFKGKWMRYAGFPVIWMTMCAVYEQLNIFGRQVS